MTLEPCFNNLGRCPLDYDTYQILLTKKINKAEHRSKKATPTTLKNPGRDGPGWMSIPKQTENDGRDKKQTKDKEIKL